MGYVSQRSVQTPLLSAVNKRKCPHFSMEHRDCTFDNQKQITWSKKSHIHLYHIDGS